MRRMGRVHVETWVEALRSAWELRDVEGEHAVESHACDNEREQADTHPPEHRRNRAHPCGAT